MIHVDQEMAAKKRSYGKKCHEYPANTAGQLLCL
jgi:hypothetical protein